MTDRDGERRREARRILERVDRDSETIGCSGLARTAGRVAVHFKAADSAGDDAIEVMGKRIGRGLALIAFIGLAIYLVATYGLK